MPFSDLLSPARPDITRLTQAAELHRGDFLTDFALHDSPEWDAWARDRREYYRRQALAALGTITQYQLDNGNIAAPLRAPAAGLPSMFGRKRLISRSSWPGAQWSAPALITASASGWPTSMICW
jgi:hypothetical protein